MAQWIKVTTEADFTDTATTICHGDKTIAIFRTEEGIFAIDDECSHAFASLAEGDLDGCEIECPLHAARFDVRTGKALCDPADEDVPCYPVKVENGIIYVEIDE